MWGKFATVLSSVKVWLDALILTEPTMLYQRGRLVGVAAESGPEEIRPLRRGSSAPVNIYINEKLEELIGRTDRPETFYYLDPPYTVADRGGYYQHAFAEEDHRRLARVLRGVKGRFLLSYDDVPLVRDLYQGFTIEATGPLVYRMSKRLGPRRRPASC